MRIQSWYITHRGGRGAYIYIYIILYKSIAVDNIAFASALIIDSIAECIIGNWRNKQQYYDSSIYSRHGQLLLCALQYNKYNIGIHLIRWPIVLQYF